MDATDPSPANGTGSCCASCAAAAAPARRPVSPPSSPQPITLAARGGPIPGRRGPDRTITLAAILIAALFVALAALSLLLPSAARLGWWLPLHLLLAGGAATAIAGIMPFFSAAVASVPAAPGSLRMVGVAGVAAGAALLVMTRWWAGGSFVVGWLGLVAGSVYLVGIAGVALATLLPLRIALGRRRAILAASYGAALLYVALGAGLGMLAIAGWTPMLDAWGVSKPAHGWLNVFGFLSLVIGASLIHLLPTVAGTRIEHSRTSMVVLGALIAGPPITAGGFLMRADVLVMAGSAVEWVGAMALLGYAADVVARRGRWSTDASWHRMTLGSLLCAIGWFVIGTSAAVATAWAGGATARGWDITILLAPLALGWGAQALTGSWSHLVPAIGPGSPAVHARQRQLLGAFAVSRLVVYQLGVGVSAIAIPTGSATLVALGLILVAGCLGCSVMLLGAAALQVRPQPPVLMGRQPQ